MTLARRHDCLFNIVGRAVGATGWPAREVIETLVLLMGRPSGRKPQRARPGALKAVEPATDSRRKNIGPGFA
jgi:hypothetical protein